MVLVRPQAACIREKIMRPKWNSISSVVLLGSFVLSGFALSQSREDNFVLSQTIDASAGKLTWAAPDVDLDGLHDLVELIPIDDSGDGISGYNLSTRFGLGDGYFGDPIIQFLPAEDIGGSPAGGEYGSAVVQLNADGFPDLLMKVRVSGDEGETYVFLALINNGGSGFYCAGDVTGDGETGVKDILTVIDDWGCGQGDPLD
jgi:hypothetical protein